jgi:hypothetical protein
MPHPVPPAPIGSSCLGLDLSGLLNVESGRCLVRLRRGSLPLTCRIPRERQIGVTSFLEFSYEAGNLCPAPPGVDGSIEKGGLLVLEGDVSTLCGSTVRGSLLRVEFRDCTWSSRDVPGVWSRTQPMPESLLSLLLTPSATAFAQTPPPCIMSLWRNRLAIQFWRLHRRGDTWKHLTTLDRTATSS